MSFVCCRIFCQGVMRQPLRTFPVRALPKGPSSLSLLCAWRAEGGEDTLRREHLRYQPLSPMCMKCRSWEDTLRREHLRSAARAERCSAERAGSTPSARLEKTSGIIEYNCDRTPPCPWHQVPHPVSLKTSRDGDSIRSLGSPFQGFITPSVKEFLPASNLHLLPWRSFRLSPFVIA